MFSSTLTRIPPLKSNMRTPKASTLSGTAFAYMLHGISNPTGGR